jgi:hypothetical protein
VADHPLRPANHRRLGRPLPYQLANGTRTHPSAKACKQRPSLIPIAEVIGMLSGINSPFDKLFQT